MNAPAVAGADREEALRETRTRTAEKALYLLRRSALATVAGALDRAGLSALVVKGAALAETVYERPWQRAMSDIDLVLAPAQIERGLCALAAAGARIVPVPRSRRWSHASMGERLAILPAGAIEQLIELHSDIDRITPAPIDWPSIFARARPLPGFATALLAPCREDHALIVILHAALSEYRHPLAAADLERLWRAGFDEAAFVERAARWRLRLPSTLALEPLVRDGRIAASPDLLERLGARRARVSLARRALDRPGPMQLGWRWTLRQALLRDDPLRWLLGLCRYGAVRAAERTAAMALP